MSVAILGLIFEGEQVRGGLGDTVDSEKVIYPEVVELQLSICRSIVRNPVVYDCFFPFQQQVATGRDLDPSSDEI